MIIIYTITLVLLTAYAILLGYYHRSFKEVPENDPVPNDYLPSTTISLLIPARNEEQKIATCIESVLAQNYPHELLQCFIIDDHSDDQTSAIVLRYKDPRIRLLSLKELLPPEAINAYKKKALETGIAKSGGDLIVTTDADCTAGTDWLRTIAHNYEKRGSVFMAGPVKMSRKKGGLFIFQSLDFLSLQGITAASVFKGFHSMCNGANLAYSRKAFYSVDGFTGIDSLASGDDMLLMHKIAKAFPAQINYLKSCSAIVTTEPAPSVQAFLQQRIRWASKARAYEDKSVFLVLLLVYIMNLFLLLIILTGVLSLQHLFWAFLFLAIKTGIEWPFMHSITRFYQEKQLMKFFPLCQPFHIIYTVIAGSFGQIGTYEWKGRKVR
ncbi:glycosyltransferase [Flavihumibacter fluvii]|uniref:glycosyltransferase n=1 Tax=Flavihumibacter fluvii TaxID=2838157 RepID=UPI001BDDE404|nr:glycosyltransferase [Flavihumibacter fluvii]ULQ51569.1 glycosyltransferase [Flavihumibacter fluvii]